MFRTSRASMGLGKSSWDARQVSRCPCCCALATNFNVLILTLILALDSLFSSSSSDFSEISPSVSSCYKNNKNKQELQANSLQLIDVFYSRLIINQCT